MKDNTNPSHPSPQTLRAIFVALLILLAITTTAAFAPWVQLRGPGLWSTGTALGIAVVKALLIALWFMHIRFSRRMVWTFAAAGFLWLGILATLVLSDYLTR